MAPRYRIRAGTARDIPTIHRMLRGLATYERLLGQFYATRASVRRDGFARRFFRTLTCWDNQTPVGVAVYLFTYSTFMARPTLYIEDIFVWPRYRGRGAGQALLAALARIAVAKGCGRMEWTVLNWNTPAIRFYRRIGAGLRKEWILTRLTGAPLRRLALAHRARNSRPRSRTRPSRTGSGLGSAG